MEEAGCLPIQNRHRIRQFRSRRRLLLVCLRSGCRAVVVSILCSMILRVPSPPLLDIKEGKAEGILMGEGGEMKRMDMPLYSLCQIHSRPCLPYAVETEAQGRNRGRLSVAFLHSFCLSACLTLSSSAYFNSLFSLEAERGSNSCS
jgi:hypothetical protein